MRIVDGRAQVLGCAFLVVFVVFSFAPGRENIPKSAYESTRKAGVRFRMDIKHPTGLIPAGSTQESPLAG
jgi:hypothetical protein